MTTPRKADIVVTNTLTIVCKAEFRDQMNASLATVDSGGATDVLSIPLYRKDDPTKAIAAYFTVWGMDDAQRSLMNQMFAQQGWRPLRGTEGTILNGTDPVPDWTTTQRWWVWNTATTTNTHAHSSLGLTLFEGE